MRKTRIRLILSAYSMMSLFFLLSFSSCYSSTCFICWLSTGRVITGWWCTYRDPFIQLSRWLLGVHLNLALGLVSFFSGVGYQMRITVTRCDLDPQVATGLQGIFERLHDIRCPSSALNGSSGRLTEGNLNKWNAINCEGTVQC